MATKISPRLAGVPRAAETQFPLRFLSVSGLVVFLAGLAILAYAIVTARSGPRQDALAVGEYVLYARFGTGADAVYEAPVSGSEKPLLLQQIPHAAEYGIVPAVSPGGERFAYLVLPPDTKAPAPDSPAELWVSDAASQGRPRRLGGGYDLLVRPVWSADGASLVVRRSGGSAGPFELLRINAASGSEVSLVKSGDALFPIAFAPGGGLYYASLSPHGSDLYRLDPGLGPVLAAHLSDDLTRDWTLSPSGASLAFLTLKQAGARVSSTVQVLDLAPGTITMAGDPNVDSIAPSWTPDGKLTLGRAAAASAITVGEKQLPAPERGFDAPLGWSRSGSEVVVRSFDGSSVSAPGRMSLTLISAQGQRRTLDQGEVTFIGWTYR